LKKHIDFVSTFAASTSPSTPAYSGRLPRYCLPGATALAIALVVSDNGSEQGIGAAWVYALDPRLAPISVDAWRGTAQAILDRLAR